MNIQLRNIRVDLHCCVCVFVEKKNNKTRGEIYKNTYPRNGGWINVFDEMIRIGVRYAITKNNGGNVKPASFAHRRVRFFVFFFFFGVFFILFPV